jgi:hypothetical protein
MQANKVSTVMAVVIATAVVSFTTAPSEAQTAGTQARQGTVRVATAVRPPAKLTVRKRSYLDPGTETKRHAEHYLDYAHPDIEYGHAPFRNSTLFNSGPALPFIHDRMPFPTCLDLAGFCQ